MTLYQSISQIAKSHVFVRDDVCRHLSSPVCVRRLGARTIRMPFHEHAFRWALQCGSGCLAARPVWSLVWLAALRPRCDVWVPTLQHAQHSEAELYIELHSIRLESKCLVHFEAVSFKPPDNNLLVQSYSIQFSFFPLNTSTQWVSRRSEPSNPQDATQLQLVCAGQGILWQRFDLNDGESSHGDFCWKNFTRWWKKLNFAAWT